MKKAFISFLIMALIASSISLLKVSTAYADSSVDGGIKVSLENIRDIMIENNLDLKILNNKLKIAKENYDDDKSTYNSTTKPTKEEYTDSTTGVYDSTAYEAALKVYNTAQSNYETAKDDLKTARTNYDQGVEDKVYAAEEAFINYLSSLSDQKLKDDTVKLDERNAQVAKIKYESGYISKNEYISLTQGNTDSVNELEKLKDSEELARIKLCNTLGISPQENVIFNADITKDFQVIATINYNEDLKAMLENNLDIQLKNDEIDDLEDEEDNYDDNDQEDIYEYKVENSEYELKQLMNNTETSFRDQYNTLMNSYNSVKSSYDKIIQEQKEYQIKQTKYDYGFASKNEVDAAKLAFDKDNAAFTANKNKLYLNYLRYIQMKEGY